MRKNKKRVDPRYFLNETAMPEEYDDRVTTAMAHLASGVMCENPDLANWGHYMSDLRWSADGDERTLDQLGQLPEMAHSENWDFARQAIMHISTYFKNAGMLDWETYNAKARSLCPKGPVYPMTGPGGANEL